LFLDIAYISQKKTLAGIIVGGDVDHDCRIVIVADALLDVAFPPKPSSTRTVFGLNVQRIADFGYDWVI
jgi:hypothetical protein